MQIESILIKNFMMMSFDEWTVASREEIFKETAIILVNDSHGQVIGGITADNPEEILAVGVIPIDRLYEGEKDWEDYSMILATDEQERIIGCLKQEELAFALYRHFKEEACYFKSVLSSLPLEVSMIDESGKTCFLNDQVLKIHGIKREEVMDYDLKDLYHGCHLNTLLNEMDKKVVMKVTDDRKGAYIQTNVLQSDRLIGAIQLYWKAEEIEKIAMNLDRFKNLSTDFQAIVDASYDVIYVSDGTGMTLHASSACEDLWGYKSEELIGKSIYKLEEMGVFYPSVTRQVLEKKQKVQVFQTTKKGRRLVCIGTPIKDEKGNIIRVVNASRDITEENHLRMELEEMRLLTEGYKQQLSQLKGLEMESESFILKSERMEGVMTLARKVAEVDSTILIQGESGVGKEVIASYIHRKSERKDEPFIKVNCGAIPENLLESELFGYEKGAFTGASKTGKPGLFELANNGTIFLDEIGEIPLALQVKLLRVLQEMEFTRIGGTKPISVNVRIIAATNRNLQEEMKKGNFREDLYYRLNVVPLFIPPLRERKDDILALTLHFIQNFNEKFQTCKTFSPAVLDLFQTYAWAGNVRELQNMIERLIVTADAPIIDIEHLPDSLMDGKDLPAVHVTDIIPIKEAIHLVESQLLLLAKKKYGTTIKIAEVLEVNQSTVSRKLKKVSI
ncbi:sigma 54-interacting transcriptional regulator [Sporosarcina sp. ACRSM]|uniref:sigma-54 interaction domain-containing protein n=1 Tax=Sporosarcina sp. ACRSM TaxID=2918216 RepID=UPI001EF68A20|nr:sigma 54-interacting transcriptional regulator [Sporosarcina sp. ACRSM]MCG7336124.1 sigma 54-interacting transcriptional regulator [Sporosarcina sp. ACRSM]